jgi:polyhydroxybutyrate depolymerase
VPLVFDFHGFLGTKEQQEVNTGMAKQGTAQGFVVVTPDSLGSPTQWNEFAAPGQADDFGFVDALLTGLSHRFCIDSTRVFAAGHSNGAAFAGFLVCKPPYRFAAVAMVSATTPTSCPKGVTPSALAIAGTADPQVPYAGGRVGDSVVQIPAATSTITAYATQYGCAQPGTDTTVASGVQQVRFAHCHDGAVVALDSVAGGTHAWPGGPAAAADPADSAAGKSFPATTAILRFFADAAPCTRRGC